MSVVYIPTFPPVGLVDRLEEDGLSPRLLADECGIGLDHRLHVSTPSGAVGVELLGPLDDLRDPPHWHAVRASPSERAVWRGPMRASAAAERLHRFIRDLLMLPPSELAERWQRLG